MHALAAWDSKSSSKYNRFTQNLNPVHLNVLSFMVLVDPCCKPMLSQCLLITVISTLYALSLLVKWLACYRSL